MSSIDTKCGPQKSFDTADKSFSSREELFTSSSFLSLQNYYHTHIENLHGLYKRIECRIILHYHKCCIQ